MLRKKQLQGAMTEEGASEPLTVATTETTKIQNMWFSSAGTCALRYCVYAVVHFVVCLCVCARVHVWFTVAM